MTSASTAATMPMMLHGVVVGDGGIEVAPAVRRHERARPRAADSSGGPNVYEKGPEFRLNLQRPIPMFLK